MNRICQNTNFSKRMISFQFKKILYRPIFEFYIICVALCQDNCQQKCWEGRPGTRVYYGSYVPSVSSENDCKDLCANNGTCVSIDWDNNQGSSDYGCWFHLTPTNNYSPGSGIYHWDLVHCSDDCLTFCWKPLKNNSGVWDTEYRGKMDENRCKLLCSQTTNCNGVDYETYNNKCWLINFPGSTETRPGIHHWDIVKNISKNCRRTANPTITHSSTFTPRPSTKTPTTITTTVSTASTTSARKSSALTQVSTSPLSDVPNPTSKAATDVTAVIALAVLSGVVFVVFVALAVVLFRKACLQRGQNSSSNVKEPEQTYDSLELADRSQDPVYTDLQSFN